ncbi:MBL fold metallo-hydrolase [Niabella drilacis]|uniref:L-ascorbate metabolism protein UlaG, beta-lactamase superfamily n=1 Tax=Niabella drilacis (strain DSM 25811 / CCM 8410 / CCUG 62505 / LMG 26954 / E90) TaxID=1285928 RepID=A0A1G6I657_NIADE|nr:MBL fold metallo-hydrolase [Niabella drilacis]SDC01984.1 L-ascorbate metabolism protein UlaG, beta-lactamase superfamily [Niabella drilacis]
MLWSIVVILLVMGVIGVIVVNQPSFGKLPSGERLKRIKKSPNYKDGKFQNLNHTPLLVGDKSILQAWLGSVFAEKDKDLRPIGNLPSIKTDLTKFAKDEDVLVWMGHSSLYLQTNGKRILVDPVLVSASPFSFYNKAFKGSDGYTPENIPEVDYLLITHDHWDHLDYGTMIQIRDRIRMVICPLGVGAHFEHWGFNSQKITEVDWSDSLDLDGDIKLTSLPARHFSGRGLKANQSLWTAYMLQCSLGNIFISGDTGYDEHFLAIKKKFGTIDFAILENGQYNEDWKYIHIMPDDLVKAVEDLQPKKVMTVHNSKYALGRHAWYEPLENISDASGKYGFNLITPMIGEPVLLKDSTQVFKKWWKP